MKRVKTIFAALATLMASSMLTSCDMWYDTGVGADINYVPGYIDVAPAPPVIGTNIWYNNPGWWYPQGPVYGGGYLPGNIRPGAPRPPVVSPNIPLQRPQRPSGGNRPLGPNIPR